MESAIVIVRGTVRMTIVRINMKPDIEPDKMTKDPHMMIGPTTENQKQVMVEKGPHEMTGTMNAVDHTEVITRVIISQNLKLDRITYQNCLLT